MKPTEFRGLIRYLESQHEVLALQIIELEEEKRHIMETLRLLIGIDTVEETTTH